MQIILEVPDKHVARVLEVVNGLKKVRVTSVAATPLTPANIEFLAGLKQSIEDVKRHQRGEIELPSWDELYAELQADTSTNEVHTKVIRGDLTQATLKQNTSQKPATQTS